MRKRHVQHTVLGLLAAALVLAPGMAGAAPKKNRPSALTIAAKPTTVTYGSSTLISGKLTGTNFAGRSITLRQDIFPFGDHYSTFGRVNTNAAGGYAFSVRPSYNTGFRADGASLTSPSIRVNVRLRISLKLSDSTPKAGRKVKFSGRVCRAHGGLVVAIQRKSGGRYRTIRHATLAGTTGCSTYARTFRVHRDGRYRVTADDSSHARGYSRSRVVDVH